jgi:hypothetical protein
MDLGELLPQSIPWPMLRLAHPTLIALLVSSMKLSDENQPNSNRLPKFNFPTYDGDTTKL